MSRWIIDFKSVEIEAMNREEALMKAQKWVQEKQAEVNMVWKQ